MHGGGWWTYLYHDEKEKPPEIGWPLIRRVATYGRPYARGIAVMLVIIVVTTLLSLIPPLLIRALIDQVIPQQNYQGLFMLSLGMIAIPVITGMLGVWQRYLSANIGEGVIYDLRVALFTHMQRMSLRFFTNTKTGELISRLNNDIIGAQQAINGTIIDIVTNVITLVSTLAIMLKLEWRLTILACAVLPLFLIPARLLGKRLRAVVREQMVMNAEMNAMMDETLNVSGALLVKLFGRVPMEVERFANRAARVRRAGIRQAFLMRWFFLLVSLDSAVGTAVVFLVGGLLVLQNTGFTTGTIIAFSAYLGMLYGPLSSLTNTRVSFAQSVVSFERVFEVLDLPVEISEKPAARHLETVRGEVRFDRVSFSYRPGENEPGAAMALSEVERWGRLPALSQEGGRRSGAGQAGEKATSTGQAAGSPTSGTEIAETNGNGHFTVDEAEELDRVNESGQVEAPDELDRVDRVSAVDGGDTDDGQTQEQGLDVPGIRYAICDVSFQVKPGQLAALVGPSGAGKTTITYLLPRLYDPTSGTISIDGYDIKDLTLTTLSDQIGMVTQETYLFNDTIRANLLYARPKASEAEIEAACRAANIHEFIVDLPEGYETVVGNRGYRLSGGEKQRLAIARVILKDPRLLVLDEATSSLDSQSEALIQEALERIMVGRTSLVIAHRLSTILAADTILVMDHGQLVEHGTHGELLAQNGLYASLYETQFRHGRIDLPAVVEAAA
jgi:ATP-binding cassette, subfamily B, bacterial